MGLGGGVSPRATCHKAGAAERRHQPVTTITDTRYGARSAQSHAFQKMGKDAAPG